MKARDWSGPAIALACVLALVIFLGAHDFQTILSSAIRLSVPLLFAAMGEYVAERAGTLNISVEAMMLGSAYVVSGHAGVDLVDPAV